jgi:hypothetical protein
MPSLILQYCPAFDGGAFFVAKLHVTRQTQRKGERVLRVIGPAGAFCGSLKIVGAALQADGEIGQGQTFANNKGLAERGLSLVPQSSDHISCRFCSCHAG